MGLANGASFGVYRIIDPLGRGGMASVYRAYEAALDRYVAIKVLPGEFLHDEQFAARFEREAKVIARLEHPNIIPIHAFGIEQGTPWMAMRLVPGGALSGLLKQQRLAVPRVLAILRGAADALDYAHAKGVVHRDVKPQNILLDDAERVYLADFGIARMIEGSAHLTQTGMITGTPQYMAPEQATGQTVDNRADIYALGIVAYEMLTGRVPFAADTPVAVLLKHVSEPLPIPSTTEVPEPLMRALLKSLAKKADDRWSTAGAFIQAMERALAEPAAPPVNQGFTQSLSAVEVPAELRQAAARSAVSPAVPEPPAAPTAHPTAARAPAPAAPPAFAPATPPAAPPAAPRTVAPAPHTFTPAVPRTHAPAPPPSGATPVRGTPAVAVWPPAPTASPAPVTRAARPEARASGSKLGLVVGIAAGLAVLGLLGVGGAYWLFFRPRPPVTTADSVTPGPRGEQPRQATPSAAPSSALSSPGLQASAPGPATIPSATPRPATVAPVPATTLAASPSTVRMGSSVYVEGRPVSGAPGGRPPASAAPPPPTPAAPSLSAAAANLVQDLASSDRDTRWRAAEALGNMGGEAKGAVPHLIRALSDSSETVRWRGAEALGKLGSAAAPAVSALNVALGDRDPMVRTESAKALGQIGPGATEAVPALGQALRASDVYFRREAAKALARISPEARAALPALTDALRDKDKFVRMESAKALGKMGPEAKTAVPALTAASRDSEMLVAREASEALRKVDRP